MKNILRVFVGVFALLTVACVTVHDNNTQLPAKVDKFAQLHSDGPRKRLLILPFINESVQNDPDLPRLGREALLDGLRQTDNYVILDNQDIPKDLTQFQKEGQYNFEELTKVTSQLGVSAIIEGKIVEVRGHQSGDHVGLIRSAKSNVEVTVRLRAYAPVPHREILKELKTAGSESQSHRIAGIDEAKGFDPELVHNALYTAYQGLVLPLIKALDKLSWNGRVALVSGERIFLNAGKLTGINIGDILRVSEDGEDVFDPATGMLIGQAPGRMKGTLEVVSFFGKDGAIAIIHSGSGFKENDHVELY